nr:reverse transcriptase domain-containing protein [Tanacetum cinerariifolium]
MLKALLSNKEKLLELANTPLNENCSAVILKKLHEKLGDPRKFLIPYVFSESELKCKDLADLAVILKKLLEKLRDPRKFLIPCGFSELKCKALSDLVPLLLLAIFLEEFADELAHITFPPGNDDLPFDIKSDLREIEYLMNHDPTKEMDSILYNSVDEDNLADPNNDLVDTIPEMFTDEHTFDYSSPPLYDDFDDDLVELESETDDVYDVPFDSKEDKIKGSKHLIDELDPPRSSDFLPSLEYDSVLYENFSKVDALPSTNNADKDFNPPLSDHELPFYKEVPASETLLSFSSENEDKNFKPGILTSKRVHTSLLPKVSNRGSKAFKAIKIFESPMEIFPCSYREDIRILDVPIAWILKTRARGFALRSLALRNPRLHFGNPIS